MKIIILIIISYILGSIPFAYLLTKLIKKIDLRKVGSKNVGATNASRILGKKWFFIIMTLDALKGFIPIMATKMIINHSSELYLILIGLASILGHTFSMFLNFKGGKGVAVSLGVLLALNYKILFIPLLIFLITVFVTKYISLSSILASITLPLSVYLIERQLNIFFIFCIVLALYVIYKHRENIKRLIQGTEKRWGEKIK